MHGDVYFVYEIFWEPKFEAQLSSNCWETVQEHILISWYQDLGVQQSSWRQNCRNKKKKKKNNCIDKIGAKLVKNGDP